MCLPGNSVLSSTKEDHQNKLLVTCYLSSADVNRDSCGIINQLPCDDNINTSLDEPLVDESFVDCLKKCQSINTEDCGDSCSARACLVVFGVSDSHIKCHTPSLVDLRREQDVDLNLHKWIKPLHPELVNAGETSIWVDTKINNPEYWYPPLSNTVCYVGWIHNVFLC